MGQAPDRFRALPNDSPSAAGLRERSNGAFVLKQQMESVMKLSDISAKLGCALEGDGQVDIVGIAGIEEAEAGHLTFLSNPKYKAKLRHTKASAAIVPADFEASAAWPLPLLRHANPYLTFAHAIELFYSPPPAPHGVHPTAVVAPTAVCGHNVRIGASSVIGEGVVLADGVTVYPNCTIYPGVRIGRNSTIHSNCVVREHVVIGEDCIVQNGAVIGADGFGYAKQADGTWYKIVQSGSVVLENRVEIGACTTVDRATIGETRIKSGSKLDNLVMIGHGSSVGENTLLCGQVGLAGSSTVGRNVMLAGQVGVAGHLHIGDNVVATVKSCIWKSVEANQVLYGNIPASDSHTWLKASAVFRQLPHMQKSVQQMQKRIAVLEEPFKTNGKSGQADAPPKVALECHGTTGDAPQG